MFKDGMISEDMFDIYGVPEDVNLDGSVVERRNGISQENRQRAKVLSLVTQICERRRLLHTKRVQAYTKKLQLFECESHEYELNKICEDKLVRIYNEWLIANNNDNERSTTELSSVTSSFTAINDKITPEMIQQKQS